MLPQYARFVDARTSSLSSSTQNQLAWALQSDFDSRTNHLKDPDTGRPKGPFVKVTFDRIVKDFDLLIDAIFTGSKVAQERVWGFKKYMYDSIIKDVAESLFGVGTHYASFTYQRKQETFKEKPKEAVADGLSQDRGILGVPANASVEDIKKHFRKLAKKAHPDAGGDVNRFLELKRAYDNLVH